MQRTPKMTTLTKENIKEHCRICLKALTFYDRNFPENVGSANEITESKDVFINIVNNAEIKQLISTFMEENWNCESTESNQEDYPQCICIFCHNKLQSYKLFRRQIRQSTQKIQELLCSGVTKVDIGEYDEFLLHSKSIPPYINTDILNFLPENTLLETETVLLDILNPQIMINKRATDPDPFEAAISLKTEEPFVLNECSNNEMSQDCYQESADKASLLSDNELFFTNTDNGILQSIKSDTNLDTTDSVARLDQKSGNDCKVIKGTTHSPNKVQKTMKGVKTINERRTEQVVHIRKPQVKLETKCADYVLKRRNKGTKNSFKCDQCHHCFAHKITLDAHIRKIHEGSKRPFQCDRCEKSYTFIGGLYTHIKEIHEAEVRSYACNIPGCDRTYTSIIAMQKHQRSKHTAFPSVRKYVCEQCGATFNQSGNLKYHRRSKHPTVEEQAEQDKPKESFECDICKKLFHSRYTLKYHSLQLHSNEMKYECNVCGRRMAKKFMLAQHMLVHSNDKIPCQHCGRLFVRKFELEAHVKAVHMKLKPFQCHYCNEAFASRKTLRHHEYIHTGEKPYVCDICGQAYRQQTCLKNHRKSHTIVNNTNTNFTTFDRSYDSQA